MLSQASNGALRASCRANPSISIGSRLPRPPPRPLCKARQRSSPYSSCALAHAASRQPPPHPSRSKRLHAQQRHQSSAATTSAPPPAREVAVLGGGLTGLTTAYYLTIFNPDAKITLYEATDRLGGWIDTEKVEVKTKDGKTAAVSFERGARVVSPQTNGRWDDFVFYELMDRLGLYRPMVFYAASTQNEMLKGRYVYYPDHLVQMPQTPNPSSLTSLVTWPFTTLSTLLFEPVFKGLLRGIMKDLSVDSYKKFALQQSLPTARVVAQYEDQSVGHFLQSMLGGPELVDNVASALFHGIWGGDVWKLSARDSNLQNLFVTWSEAGTPGLSVVKEFDFYSGKDIIARNPAAGRMATLLRRAKYMGFMDGFNTLTNALADALAKNPNVTIEKGTPVREIGYQQNQRKAVVHLSGKGKAKGKGKRDFDKVISSLYSGTLASITGNALPSLKSSTAVTIQIVNLWYPNTNLKDYTGFGYLIPQSVSADRNPHAALGVLFDSDRDAAVRSPEVKAAPGTKLTVMLGGHYWDHLDPQAWPDADEAAVMAMDTVHRQMGIPLDEPVYGSTKVCRECIPQHLVGHRERMEQAHHELLRSFGGSLAVVGGSYTLPGVLPSLRAARDMALQVAGKGYLMDEEDHEEFDMSHVGETGLLRFVGDNEKIIITDSRSLPFRGSNLVKKFGRFEEHLKR